MSAQLQNVRCVCPVAHIVCSVTTEGDRLVTTDELQQRMRDSVAEGLFGTVCDQCGAPRETWRIEAEWR